MSELSLSDPVLMGAVSKIDLRSERQVDVDKLLETFVDTGVVAQLNNRNHQIFFGRRGTGKTHVLRVLEQRLRADPHNTVVYIDARTLGSSAQFSDDSKPLRIRCLALFRDILYPVKDALLERVVATAPARSEEALEGLRELESSIHAPTVKQYATDRTATKTSTETNEGAFSLGLTKAGVSLDTGLQSLASSQDETKYRIETEDKVVFPALHDSLSRVLTLAETTAYILIDEWSTLPAEVQPYLAEFLKRGVLPNNQAVVKIAALEYRSHFRTSRGVGLELGADISLTLHLDDYFVYDKSPEDVSQSLASMLYKHLSIGLPPNYLAENGIADASDLQTKLFTERKIFRELARASEGVARDFINIFNKAYFDAKKRQRNSIDRAAVIAAARTWFEQDKSQSLGDEQHRVLEAIVTQVIGAKKARSFLVPRELQNHPVLQGLFDARVVHLVQRGYADKDNPGVRYDIYTLDYGTYVDLIGTSKQPELNYQFHSESDESDLVVPFDDKRSIRRIILPATVLEAAERLRLPRGDS